MEKNKAYGESPSVTALKACEDVRNIARVADIDVNGVGKVFDPSNMVIRVHPNYILDTDKGGMGG